MKKPNGIQIEIDAEAEAIYIRLSTNQIKTTKELETDVLVDLDARGRPVGLEFLDPTRIASGLRKFQRQYDTPFLRRIRTTALQELFV